MYPRHHVGGYELVWQGAVRALREAGHRVRILTTDFRLLDAADLEEHEAIATCGGTGATIGSRA